MAHANYKAAVFWIAANDDTEWLREEPPILSVTAALVCDLFGKDEAVVIADIRKELKRQGRASCGKP